MATGTQIKASPGATFGVNFTPARKRGKIFAFFEYKRVQENITYKPITKFRKGKLFVGSSPYFNEMTRLSKGKAKMKLTRYRWVKGKWGRWKEPRKAVIKLRHRNTGRYLRLVFKDNNGNGKWRSNLYWDGPQGGFPLT